MTHFVTCDFIDDETGQRCGATFEAHHNGKVNICPLHRPAYRLQYNRKFVALSRGKSPYQPHGARKRNKPPPDRNTEQAHKCAACGATLEPFAVCDCTRPVPVYEQPVIATWKPWK